MTTGTATVNKKVGAAGLGGLAITPLVVWVWGMVFPDYPMPAEVAGSIGGIIAFLVGYFVRET